MIVVADTTPLLYLSRIGQLELLRHLYKKIFVPTTIWREAVVVRPDALGAESLLAAPWIIVSDGAERAGLDRSLEEALDPGEAAAITLAEMVQADFLLIDERKGRTVARERGSCTKCTGTTLPGTGASSLTVPRDSDGCSTPVIAGGFHPREAIYGAATAPTP